MKILSKRRSKSCDDEPKEIEDLSAMIGLFEGAAVNDDLRVIYISGDLCSEMALEVHNATLKLLNQDVLRPIIYQISSPGGDLVTGAFPLVETFRMARELVDVYTYCQGVAYSGAALLLASGDVDCRFVSPLSQIMLHDVQTNFGWMDSSTDLPRSLELIDTYKKMYLETFAFEIGKVRKESKYISPSTRALKDIKKELRDLFEDGDNYLTSEETTEIGIADHAEHLMPQLDALDALEEMDIEEEEEGELEDE